MLSSSLTPNRRANRSPSVRARGRMTSRNDSTDSTAPRRPGWAMPEGLYGRSRSTRGGRENHRRWDSTSVMTAQRVSPQTTASRMRSSSAMEHPLLLRQLHDPAGPEPAEDDHPDG